MTGSPQILPSSFRDPHGFVFRVDGVLLRQVNQAHRKDFDAMISSGLHDALVADRILVPHEVASLDLAATPSAYRVIRPEVVPFVSYPYEWCFSALRDAALLTLHAQEVALAHGMSLRDASAYNVQFLRGRPILIDTLSFEVLPSGQPWVAYRQFCEHFLAPLALMSMRDVRLGRTLSTFLEGLPLDLAATLLPARARVKVGLQLHLTMHARSQARHSDVVVPRSRRSFSLRAFQGLLSSLRKAVHDLDTPRGPSLWNTYYEETSHYPADAAARKESIVRSWIGSSHAGTVWDLGANTGRFARFSAERGVETLAFDVDPLAVDNSYRSIRTDGLEHLLPLVMDLTNPSPAIGWAHHERMSLLERGPADLNLALAIVHHLAIGSNVPLKRIVDLLADVGRHVILEWVPKEDPKVSQMLRSREDVFEDYTEGALIQELDERFMVKAREQLPDMDRALYLLRRR